MQKICLLLASIFLFVLQGIAQAPASPESFLGYPLGSHFTPHYRIVSYFESVAASVPSMVRIQRYGKTNEGRPLMVAFVGLPENIAKLEDIRKNNLRLAGMLDDAPGNESAPAIIWLSYNVHGNEPSSSEAAMKTLYALVDPANATAREWLKNTIVVIDPCLNPDGRDRYVNWFNQVADLNPNTDPESREHDEPWPGGRTNHYNFDLNRDWFWQTQVESRARVQLYNSWMPQVHVDYHEQGYNAPYYFAPAAEPYHEVITRWQRDFQVAIGKNHARYFDQNGWLFFTKQEFDLFYPSYGDTYPLYNGAIGMTYEQGGHSRGGLAVLTENGDTLTLRDRVLHHFTTGMSTIEMGSKNAQSLVHEFHAYFQRNLAEGSGPYQAYVVSVDSDKAGNGRALEELLDRNRIRYGSASGTVRGWDYFTRSEASYTLKAGDIVIPARQPKATLLKVLFEPDSKISDSVTYDITAWSLPYAYGLKTYAVKTPVSVHLIEDAPAAAHTFNATGEQPYGYLIPWTGLGSARALSYLLGQKVKVRVNQQPFEEQGEKFGAGSLLILATGNGPVRDSFPRLMDKVNRTFGTPVIALNSGFVDKGSDLGSDRVKPLNPPRVALLTGNNVSSSAAGEVWYLFERELGYPLTLVNAEDFPRANWSAYDVVILPDGYYSWLSDKKVGDALHNWVTQGGRLIALEGAASQLASAGWGFKVKKAGGDDAKSDEKKDDKKDSEEKKPSDADTYALLKRYGDREREELGASVPGAIYRVDLDSTHPLGFGFPSYYYTLRQDNTVYQFMEEGWNVGALKKNNYVSGFVGNKAKQQLQDGLLFGVEDLGRGHVIFLADNPLFRDFWENGKLLFCNAVFMTGN